MNKQTIKEMSRLVWKTTLRRVARITLLEAMSAIFLTASLLMVWSGRQFYDWGLAFALVLLCDILSTVQGEDRRTRHHELELMTIKYEAEAMARKQYQKAKREMYRRHGLVADAATELLPTGEGGLDQVLREHVGQKQKQEAK